MNGNLLLIAVTLILGAWFVIAQQMITINFDQDKSGELPKDFAAALTGNGKQGVWLVVKDDSSPAQKNVLAQTDNDATSYRFPVCVYEKLSAKDVDVVVKFKTVSGKGSGGRAGLALPR